jgi:hypothetical protein
MLNRLKTHIPHLMENASLKLCWWKRNCLDALPDDIIMHIMREYMSLQEILLFRQVCCHESLPSASEYLTSDPR